MANLNKNKIIYYIASGVAILIILAIAAGYYFGQPGKDRIGYESKFYVIDRCNESIFVAFSGSSYSRTHKRIMLLEERKNELSTIGNTDKLAEFQNKISRSYSAISKNILKVSDTDKRNILIQELAEVMLGLLYQNSQSCTGNTCTSETIKDIIQKVSQDISQLPQDQQQKIKTQNKQIIESINASSQSSFISSDQTVTDGGDENNEKTEAGTEDKQGDFFPIATISKEQIDAIIKTKYQGDYTFKTTNVLKSKGYIASSIAIPDNFGALFIIKNTANGLVIDSIIDDDDYSLGTKPEALTDVEWQWLLYNVDYNYENAINYN